MPTILVEINKKEKCSFSSYYLVRNKRTGYDLKKTNDFEGGSGGYVP